MPVFVQARWLTSKNTEIGVSWVKNIPRNIITGLPRMVSLICRVAEVQLALESSTGIPAAEQILIFRGSGLDPSKALGHYGLPMQVVGGEPSVETSVFLFHRRLLYPGTSPPAPNPQHVPNPEFGRPSDLQGRAGGLGDRFLLPHAVAPPPAARPMLCSSSNPALQQLGESWWQVAEHAARGQALLAWARDQLGRCRVLLNECRVLSLGVEAAAANINSHYQSVKWQGQVLLNRQQALQAATEEAGGRLEEDLQVLAAIPLPRGLGPEPPGSLLGALAAPPESFLDWRQHCARLARTAGQRAARLETRLQVRAVIRLGTTGAKRPGLPHCLPPLAP